MHQQELTLLLCQPPDINQCGRSGTGTACGIKNFVQAATDHMDLGPICRVAPAIKLAACELADRDDEGGVANFFAQSERLRQSNSSGPWIVML